MLVMFRKPSLSARRRYIAIARVFGVTPSRQYLCRPVAGRPGFPFAIVFCDVFGVYICFA